MCLHPNLLINKKVTALLLCSCEFCKLIHFTREKEHISTSRCADYSLGRQLLDFLKSCNNSESNWNCLVRTEHAQILYDLSLTRSFLTVMEKDRHSGHLEIETNGTDVLIWSSRSAQRSGENGNGNWERHEWKTLEDLSPFRSLES